MICDNDMRQLRTARSPPHQQARKGRIRPADLRVLASSYAGYRKCTDSVLIMQTSCNTLCDPYIETDSLSIFIDLLLVKKAVYRHMLYNLDKGKRYTLKLAFTVLLADVYLTWSKNVLQSSNDHEDAFKPVLHQLKNIVLIHLITITACTTLKSARSLNARSNVKWYTISETIFLSSMTRLFFMSLALIWPEGRPSHSLQFSRMNSINVNTEDFLLAALEFINRGVALSALVQDDLLGLTISLFSSIATFFTPMLST